MYEIDGNDFSTLKEFYDVISRVLIPGAEWGHNLDAFNDILRGGFGTPENGFILRWRNHHVSQERLGYPETARQLGLMLERCHPNHRADFAAEREQARAETETRCSTGLSRSFASTEREAKRQKIGSNWCLRDCSNTCVAAAARAPVRPDLLPLRLPLRGRE